MRGAQSSGIIIPPYWSEMILDVCNAMFMNINPLMLSVAEMNPHRNLEYSLF